MRTTVANSSALAHNVNHIKKLEKMVIAVENRLLNHGLTCCQMQRGNQPSLLKWGFSSCICSIGNGRITPFGYKEVLRLSIKFIENAEAISTKVYSQDGGGQTIEVFDTNHVEYCVHLYFSCVTLLQAILMSVTVRPHRSLDKEKQFLVALKRIYSHHTCILVIKETGIIQNPEDVTKTIDLYFSMNIDSALSTIDMLRRFVLNSNVLYGVVMVKFPEDRISWCTDFILDKRCFSRKKIEKCFKSLNTQIEQSIME
ncbi:hypothetical protein H4219_003135 [Mycoemilia scoparia]|uniref:Uncharacterized protein n=1 Tax=Mycoemilia scoparia TaxID=417184 RepID=A0A9W8A261_9FUNG|nr:hypothetical protein H4219_003135 [Mycoemilia scoparia]